MTKEEAIRGLERLAKDFGGYKPNEEMFEMAIEALKAQDAPEANVGDTISRAAAIDTLYHVDEYNGRSVEAIRNLPSAQPERKTGKWEIYVISMLDGEGCRCSECGYEGVPYWDFCPDCGADMRGKEKR